jgi:hypothetical protein
VLRGHSGLEALGGGSFEEVVRPPLGNCSINTRAAICALPIHLVHLELALTAKAQRLQRLGTSDLRLIAARACENLAMCSWQYSDSEAKSRRSSRHNR